MVMLGRLECDQRGTHFQSTVLVEAKTAQVVPHTLTHHEHSTSKLHGAPTHSTAHTKHKYEIVSIVNERSACDHDTSRRSPEPVARSLLGHS